MPLIIKLIFIIGFLFSDYAAAAMTCNRTTAKTVRVEMNMNNIIIYPSTAVGSVLTSQTYPVPANGKMMFECSGGSGTVWFNSVVTMSGATRLPDNVYSTNVPGIGLRFTRLRGSNSPIVYPDRFSDSVPRSGNEYYLDGSTFKVEVIKTAEVTGSGTITSGEYTSYYPDGFSSNPILITYLNADSITIVSPSCTITSGQNQTVTLSPIGTTMLRGKDTFTGETPFSIQLFCPATPFHVGNTASLTFDGDIPVGYTKSNGVLLNTLSRDNGGAKGVGIQVLSSENRPLEFDKSAAFARLSNVNQTINVNYLARYYQYEGSISSGMVNAQMVFNITYD